MEYQTHGRIQKKKSGLFVTLTYSPENLPPGNNLSKKEIQLYIKRIRKALPHREIKYYAVGEYGGINGRAHYHLIMLGLKPADAEIAEKCWQNKGHVKISDDVNELTTAYTAGYVQKKWNKKEKAQNKDKQPPFSLMSKGLGLDYAKDNEKLFKKNVFIMYRGKKAPIPRYFRKKLGITEEYFTKILKKLEEQEFIRAGKYVRENCKNKTYSELMRWRTELRGRAKAHNKAHQEAFQKTIIRDPEK